MLPYFKKLSTFDHSFEEISKEMFVNLPKFDSNFFNCIKNNALRYDKIDGQIFNNLPKLASWLDKQNIDPNSIMSFVRFYTPSKSEMYIHVDGVSKMNNGGENGEAINFPLTNYNDSYVIWYDNAEPYSMTEQEVKDILGPDHYEKVGKSTYNSQLISFQRGMAFKPEAAVEVARVKLDSPVWVNTGLPHKGINTGNKGRFTFSIRFKDYLKVDDLC